MKITSKTLPFFSFRAVRNFYSVILLISAVLSDYNFILRFDTNVPLEGSSYFFFTNEKSTTFYDQVYLKYTGKTVSLFTNFYRKIQQIILIFLKFIIKHHFNVFYNFFKIIFKFVHYIMKRVLIHL